jgi:hypothetical protein
MVKLNDFSDLNEIRMSCVEHTRVGVCYDSLFTQQKIFHFNVKLGDFRFIPSKERTAKISAHVPLSKITFLHKNFSIPK